ncbi:IS30 family transposase, partial [Lactiplantibacillus pentosus]
QTKVAIVLNSHTKSAHDVNRSLAGWLSKLPRHLFKSITFDNGLLRKDGLRHNLIMDQLSDGFVQAVASRRNHIPRKSLGYQT